MDSPVTRRSLLATGLAVVTAGCSGLPEVAPTETTPGSVECSGTARSGWSSYQGGPANRGQSAAPGPTSGSSSVVTDLPNQTAYGPVLCDGDPVSVAGDTVVRARSDDERWQASLDSVPASSLAVNCQAVVVQTRGGTVALEADTGDVRWRRSISPSVSRASPLVLGDRLIAPTQGAAVTAFALVDGTTDWETIFENQVVNGLAATPETVYVTTGASGAGYLAALEAASGTEQWRADHVGECYADPVLGPTHVYVQNTDGQLLALDPGTGETAWERSVSTDGTDDTFLAVDDGDRAFLATSTYGSPSTGTIVALDVGDGSTVWETDVGRVNWIPPVISDEMVYIGNADGIHALDRRTGEQRWQVPDVPVRRGLCLADGTLYCHDQARLVAIR